jgi:hypothetical protein
MGICSIKENTHDRAGNRTRDLIIISQKLWPLDHEAGHSAESIFIGSVTVGNFEKDRKRSKTHAQYISTN